MLSWLMGLVTGGAARTRGAHETRAARKHCACGPRCGSLDRGQGPRRIVTTGPQRNRRLSPRRGRTAVNRPRPLSEPDTLCPWKLPQGCGEPPGNPHQLGRQPTDFAWSALAKTDEERALRTAWLVLVAAALAVAGVAGLIGRQVTRPLPALSLTAELVSVQKPDTAHFSWPEAREAAVTVRGLAAAWSTSDQPVVPIASVTKIMTAYIVLRDHPLTGDGQGPSIAVTQADVATYQSDVGNGDSSAAVAAGEALTEREALEALLLPSADNIATLLADWDAGSRAS